MTKSSRKKLERFSKEFLFLNMNKNPNISKNKVKKISYAHKNIHHLLQFWVKKNNSQFSRHNNFPFF